MKLKTKISGLLIVALGCLAFSGCSRVAVYGTQQIPSSAKQIRKGWTTKQEVIELLGNPAEVVRPDATKEILVYESVTERPKASIWSVIFFNIGFKPGIKKQTTRLTVILDSSEVVQDYKLDELYSEYLPAYTPSSPPPLSPGATSSYQYRSPAGSNYSYR